MTLVTIAGFGDPLDVIDSVSDLRRELDVIDAAGWIKLTLSPTEVAARGSEAELFVRPEAIVAYLEPKQPPEADEQVEQLPDHDAPDVVELAAHEARARGMSPPAPDQAEAFLRDVGAGLAGPRLDEQPPPEHHPV